MSPLDHLSGPAQVSVVIVRKTGPHTSIRLPGYHVLETSLEQLAFRLRNGRSVVADLNIGTIVLEDLHVSDLSPELRAELKGREGVSCPVVTRWTNPDPNA